MIDYKKQLKENQTELDLYRLFSAIERFAKRMDKNQHKLDQLAKHPEKLTHLSYSEVLDYLRKAQDELQYMRKYAISFYSAYEKLCKFELEVSRRQSNDKLS